MTPRQIQYQILCQIRNPKPDSIRQTFGRIPCRKYSNCSKYKAPTPTANDRIFVAVSGGVDSSFVLWKLAQEYPVSNITAVYMSNWTIPRTPRAEYPRQIPYQNQTKIKAYLEDQHERDRRDYESGLLCSETDWADVEAVCDQLGVRNRVRISFEKEYWADVFEPMIRAYERGETPNPDVSCNRYIKFGKLYEAVEKMALDENNEQNNWWLATGHYVKTARDTESNTTHLLQPRDKTKDQSYYLSNIDYRRLDHLLFPLQDMTKTEVRQQAQKVKLLTANRPDSQGLCFVAPTVGAAASNRALEHGQKLSSSKPGYVHFRDFLAEYIPARPGNIITTDGYIVGRHAGLWHATIGQASSVEMHQSYAETTGKWLVIDKLANTNELVIARRPATKYLESRKLTCRNWVWLVPESEVDRYMLGTRHDSLTIRIRSLGDFIPITGLVYTSEVDEFEQIHLNPSIEFTFKVPALAVAQGQSATLYLNERIIGSGMISNRTLVSPYVIPGRVDINTIRKRQKSKRASNLYSHLIIN
ncbi:tRNA-specific 2-thiouridylase [Lipomyces oligophaga]|uniref:tRNA-specific 2-thiouridylase n=1 Tax=Lipomyces oligophaga TaxID=45792 RepID=UPI0034CE0AB3